MDLKLDFLQRGWVIKLHRDHGLLQVFDRRVFYFDPLLKLLRVCQHSKLLPQVHRHLVDLCIGISQLLHDFDLPAAAHLLFEQVGLLLANFDLDIDAFAQVFKGEQLAILHIVFDGADKDSIGTVPR